MSKIFGENGVGGLLVNINCKGVYVAIVDSLFSSNEGYFTGNLGISFQMLTDNFISVRNVTAVNGTSDRGPGITVTLGVDIELNDPLSCDPDSIRSPHHLMELEQLLVVNNRGIGALMFEDRVYPSHGQDCAAQYVLIKNSTFAGNYNPQIFYSGTAVRLSPRPHILEYTTFKIIQATFENVTFASNSAPSVTTAPSAAVYAEIASNVSFIDCIFENNLQSALGAWSSTLIFSGTNLFRNNSGYYGTGITLMWTSYIFLQQGTEILFADNHASSVGGALYVEPGIVPTPICFFQVIMEGLMSDPVSTVHVGFYNNTADYAGSSLYGAHVSGCYPLRGMASGGDQFERIFNITNSEEDPSTASSNPESVCFCESGRRMPNCSVHNLLISAYPGEDFVLRLAVVSDTLSGTVPGAIHAFFNGSNPNASFGVLQDSQMHNHTVCWNFTYTILTARESVEFFVAAERLSFQPYNLQAIPRVSVLLKECPLGFSLSKDLGKCVCDPVLGGKGVECYISNKTILRPPLTWIGFVDGNFSTESNKTGIIFHDHCPLDYCLDRQVALNQSSPDAQCVSHRTGILCGMCEEGHSLTLGGEDCSKCSNVYLLLLLPFSIAGLVLVVLLFALNLTVTEGSVNGLIFYANVVEIARLKLYPEASTKLHTFIAWLNLDLGIDSCFFDGLDAYAKTWLQLVFPVYLWVIIIVIVIVCNKFPALAANSYGQNALKVLATLLLLSYTKLQRTVVTIFSFTSLKYPGGATRYVWLYDANVEFLTNKHLYLYIAGMLVLVALILPYTLSLALFQQLQACSGRRAFRWVNKLKPIFDSYAGPYKDRYRVWMGLLLAARTILIVLLSANISDSPDFSLFVIGTTSSLLLLVMASSGGVYRKWSHNLLESFFHLQLVVFAGGITYASHNRGSIAAAAYYSYGSSLLAFLVIVGHRLFARLMEVYRRWKGYAAIEVQDPLAFCGRDARGPVGVAYPLEHSDNGQAQLN